MMSRTPSTVLPRKRLCTSSTESLSPSSPSNSLSTRLARYSLSTSTPSQSKISAGRRELLKLSSVLARGEIDEGHGAATHHVLRKHPVPFLHGFPLDELGVLLERFGADLHGLRFGFRGQNLL